MEKNNFYISEFICLANEADSSNLTVERLLLALITTKCLNKDLKTELLRNPTSMKDAVAKAKQYDAA